MNFNHIKQRDTLSVHSDDYRGWKHVGVFRVSFQAKCTT